MTDAPAAFTEALIQYAKIYGFLHSQAEIDLRKMTDEELADFGAALDGPTQTNCGFEFYQVAQILRPLYRGEVYRRAGEAMSPMTGGAAERLLDMFPAHSDEWSAIRQLIGYRTEFLALQRQVATPPDGWFTFGHHADDPDKPQLEFWGDEHGIPLWERPATSKAWHSVIPGEVWDVTYQPYIKRETGFLNQNGEHVVYEANGDQLYFRRLEDDGARGHLAVTNPLIQTARRIRRAPAPRMEGT